MLAFIGITDVEVIRVEGVNRAPMAPLALPLNLILLPLVAFVLWGRGKRAPVATRG
nr:hypothetical protein [Sinorhizobium meliloti]